MSDEKISQLTSGVPAQGADILPIARPSAPGVAYSVTAQSIANLSSSTPGGSNNTIQGNKAGVFFGIPGTAADFVNGLIAIAPTGTGVALSVTGDAHGSGIINLYSNGVSPAAFSVDTFGNTTIISQGTGLVDAALNVTGDSDGDDIFKLSCGNGGEGTLVVQQGDGEIALSMEDSGGLVYIRPSYLYYGNPGGTAFLGRVSGGSGPQPAMLYITSATSGSYTTYPFGMITVWGDAQGNDIQQWNVNANAQGGFGYVPSIRIDSTGSLHLSKAIYDSTGSAGTVGQILTSETSGSPAGPTVKWVTPSTTTRTTAIQYVIDGGGSIVGTGLKGQINMPIGGTITGWTLTADQPGSAVIDVLRSTYANFSTTVSIVGSGNGPNLSGVQKNQSLSLSGWTSITLNQYDEVQFNVISASSVMRLNLTINMTVSG
jgi:hypothetical protein